MMAESFRLKLFLGMVITLAVIGVACSSSEDPTPGPTIPGSAAIFFPYIFQGNFTVAGEPGPEGVPMFARLGDGRGPFNDSVRPGEYINVSVAADSADEIGGEITFYLGHPDGPNVRAEETFVYNRTAQPQFIELDLTFPRLP